MVPDKAQQGETEAEIYRQWVGLLLSEYRAEEAYNEALRARPYSYHRARAMKIERDVAAGRLMSFKETLLARLAAQTDT